MGTPASERILSLLGDGQVWTGQRLAEHSGLSLRTVRRAVGTLRDEGVAIDTDVGRGGGLRLGARSALPRVRLSHREAVGLLFALAVAESLGLPLLGRDIVGLRTRLSAMFAPPERAEVHRLRGRILVGQPASEVVRSSWRDPDARQTLLQQEAFLAARVVRFRYRSRDQRLSPRCVEPQYLQLNHPAWYRWAWTAMQQRGARFDWTASSSCRCSTRDSSRWRPSDWRPMSTAGSGHSSRARV
jgi:predicted DNA-binding transcriptional regulator YafY